MLKWTAGITFKIYVKKNSKLATIPCQLLYSFDFTNLKIPGTQFVPASTLGFNYSSVCFSFVLLVLAVKVSSVYSRDTKYPD